MENYLMQMQFLLEIALAMFLASLMGLEREFADKPAGMRTHMLVAGSAAMVVNLGKVLMSYSHSHPEYTFISADPTRVLQAIIVGISFLGAGTIIRRQQTEVEGLTTAASILVAATIGIGVALEQYFLTVGLTLLVIFVLSVLRHVEYWVLKKRNKLREKRKQDS